MLILDMLNKIASDSGKIFKEDKIREFKHSALFKKVLLKAYCPLTNYYMKKIPEYVFKEKTISLETAVDSLDRLSSRELTGNKGKDFLKYLLENLCKEDAIVLERIIDRSLKIGCGVKTINKVFEPDLIKKAPYMGAVSYSYKKIENLFKKHSKLYWETKMDGRYGNLKVFKDKVEAESRQSKPTSFGGVFQSLKELWLGFSKNIVLNGELLIPGIDRLTSNGILASLASIGEKLVQDTDAQKDLDKFEKKYSISFEGMCKRVKVVVWDFLPLENYYLGVWDKPRKERLEELEKVIKDCNIKNIELIEYGEVNNIEEAFSKFEELLIKGEEGAILKTFDGIWKSGKPTYQLKMKLEFMIDLKIIGFNEGTKGSKFEGTLGSFQCESLCGKLRTDPGGIGDSLRDQIWNDQDASLGKIIEVKCNGLSQNRDGAYSVFHPVYKRFRDDTTADTLDEIIQIDEMVKTGKSILKKGN